MTVFMVCKKCNYYVEYLDDGVTLVESWDMDEVCYDEDNNMIGNGKHELR